MHVHGHLDRRGAVALTHAALEHEQAPLLDGELDVLHVLVVLLKAVLNFEELLVASGHGGLERGESLALRVLRVLIDGGGRTDTGHHVFALGVDQVLTVEVSIAVARVARESDAGGRIAAHVAEHHGLHVDGGSPLVRNLLDAAVVDGALAVPATEHGADAAPQLILRIVGEGLAKDVLDDLLELDDETLEVIDGQVCVALVTFLFLHCIQALVEHLADAFAVLGLDAGGFLHDDVRVHHDEAAVGVVREAGIARLLDEALDGHVVEADVEHGVHHAGHRAARARANRQEKRVLGIAKLLLHQAFDGGHGLAHFVLQLRRVGLAVGVVVGAQLGGDGESGWNRKLQRGMAGHFCEVGAFATQQVLHGFVAVGLAAAERIDVLGHYFTSPWVWWDGKCVGRIFAHAHVSPSESLGKSDERSA